MSRTNVNKIGCLTLKLLKEKSFGGPSFLDFQIRPKKIALEFIS